MIKKIVRIGNVGKLSNCVASGDTEFRRLNLLFAENAQGKTTLSAILRSLTTGKPDYVLERQTLQKGNGSTISIHIHVDGTQYIFDGKLWNKKDNLPKIEIFDEQFVTDNVYSGSYIDPEHRENLLQFIIGEEGVKYAERISKLSNDIKGINDRLSPLKTTLKGSIKGNIDVDMFVDLKKVDDIEKKIEEKKLEQTSIGQKDQIQSHNTLDTIEIPKVNLDEINRLLSKDIVVLSEDAERKVLDHIKSCLDDKGKEWIEQGLLYTKNGSCPFCGQSLTGVSLIAEYRTLFNEAYTELKKEIICKIDYMEETFADVKLLSLRNHIETNKRNSTYWGKFISLGVAELNCDHINTLLTSLKANIINILKRKTDNSLDNILTSEEMQPVFDSYITLLSNIETYNKDIVVANKAISIKKNDLLLCDSTTVEKELFRLINVKTRYSDTVSPTCEKYNGLLAEKNKLEDQINFEKENLKNYTISFLTQYRDSLNSYLYKFGANFKICNVTDKYYNRTPRLEYCIDINGIAVELGNEKKTGNTACFRNTLSSGDKTTLAFALFVTRLMSDKDINNKIVVFDDPISSLDDHRKTFSAQIIRSVCEKAKQVLVLSHNPLFLRTIWESPERSRIKTLKIEEMSDGNRIVPWDLEQETRADYFKVYDEIHDFISDMKKYTDLQPIAQKIRILLEGYLKTRFPLQLRSCNELGAMISIIRSANQIERICGDDFFEDLSNINEFSRRYHHSSMDRTNSLPINESELKTNAKIALKLLNTF